MNTRIRLAFAAALAALTVSALAEEYGAPLTLTRPIPLDQAARALGDKASAEVLVEARVDKVCEARGCWIGLWSRSGDIRVTFKDESFFVPLSLKGKTVIVQGVLSQSPMTLEQTREQARARGADPAAVQHADVHYEIVASGIVVKS